MKTLSILGLALALLTAPAGATIVQALDLEQLSKKADVVVHGDVVDQKTNWNTTRSRIYTVTRVRIRDPLKGPHKKGAVIEIRQLGGTVGEITQSIVGNARLSPAEEVLLFLNHDPEKQRHYIVGMAQGKYAIDRSGKPAVVRHDLRGLALADLDDGRLNNLKHGTDEKSDAITVAQFKRRIRGYLSATP